MFKFAFSADEDEKLDHNNGDDNDEKSAELDWFPASEIKVTSEQMQQSFAPDDYTETAICGLVVKIMIPENIVASSKNEDYENIRKAELKHSDLLPAIYEGGLKIWECSYDLGKYLIESGVPMERKKVLDLGCGAGLIGLIALLKGSSVHFQDYNAEVIQLATIPNVLLNLNDRQNVRNNCEFYCGDWASFEELTSQKYSNDDDKYDLILTSETIYNPDNQKKLYNVFKRRLKQNGVGYVAGKTYYFGVGGGMRQFEKLVKDDGLFDVENVWTSPYGLQREIMMLKRSKP